jgi:ribosomal protein S18 acetylase RimI-like enzyme
VENLSEYARKLAERAVFIVAEDNFRVVGFTAMYANDSISEQAYLAGIAVSKEYLGQKIGKLLLGICEKTAKENGMKTMKLEVDKINEHAIEFYKKNGFSTESVNDLSLFMVKNLQPVLND